jgi:hypothetical protein
VSRTACRSRERGAEPHRQPEYNADYRARNTEQQTADDTLGQRETDELGRCSDLAGVRREDLDHCDEESNVRRKCHGHAPAKSNPSQHGDCDYREPQYGHQHHPEQTSLFHVAFIGGTVQPLDSSGACARTTRSSLSRSGKLERFSALRARLSSSSERPGPVPQLVFKTSTAS